MLQWFGALPSLASLLPHCFLRGSKVHRVRTLFLLRMGFLTPKQMARKIHPPEHMQKAGQVRCEILKIVGSRCGTPGVEVRHDRKAPAPPSPHRNIECVGNNRGAPRGPTK